MAPALSLLGIRGTPTRWLVSSIKAPDEVGLNSTWFKTIVMTYRGGGDNCDCFIRECQSQFGTLLTSLVSYMTYPLTPAGSREYNCAFLCTMTVIASRHVNDRVLYVPDLVSHQSPPPLSPHSVTDLQSYKYHPNRPLTSPIER